MALFGKKIEPSCTCCEWGVPEEEEGVAYCKKNGIVSLSYSCRHFRYSPLRRRPKPAPSLPKFKPEDFKL